MGYRSTIVIGVDKQVYTEHFIANTVPALLQEADEHISHMDVLYWVFHSYKWYDSYPEVIAMQAWFSELADRQDAEHEHALATDGPNRILYGAARTGEEYDDIEEWGEPWALGINLVRYIDYPTA